MKVSLDSVFQESDSEAGKKKALLLTENRVIVPKYAEAGLAYRTSWETLLKFGEIGPSVFADAMKQAEDGASTAKQLESQGGESFVCEFCVVQVQAFREGFTNYNPEHGFDLDIFIIVGNMFDFQTLEVYYEIFPRIAAYRMSTSFASRISYRTSLKVSEEEVGGPRNIVTPIHGLLQGEGGARGEAVNKLARRITVWHERTKGIWPIHGEFLINCFLNRTIASIVLSSGESILCAGVHRGFDGDSSDASFKPLHIV